MSQANTLHVYSVKLMTFSDDYLRIAADTLFDRQADSPAGSFAGMVLEVG